MAYPNLALIDALRVTANRLSKGSHYAWGHHGACNCGNLLQVVAQLSQEEILTYAHTGIGEWTELSQESCSVSHAPFSLLLKKLEEIGLTPTDIHHLEYLNNREVLEQLPDGFRWLKRNQREDVIVYFNTFAQVLENRFLAELSIPDPNAIPEPVLNY